MAPTTNFLGMLFFGNPIGQLCLSGPGYSSRTVRSPIGVRFLTIAIIVRVRFRELIVYIKTVNIVYALRICMFASLGAVVVCSVDGIR